MTDARTATTRTKRRVEALRRAARTLRSEAAEKASPVREELLVEAGELDLMALELAGITPPEGA